eukprot:jgi/Mesvir1/22026/Mv15914-RA.4
MRTGYSHRAGTLAGTCTCIFPPHTAQVSLASADESAQPPEDASAAKKRRLNAGTAASPSVRDGGGGASDLASPSGNGDDGEEGEEEQEQALSSGMLPGGTVEAQPDDDDGGGGAGDGDVGEGEEEEPSVVAAAPAKEKRRPPPRPTMKQMETIVAKISKKDTYHVFQAPVDPKELPDYYDIITSPMDLGTIRAKVQAREYKTWNAFMAHVKLVCSNAMTYNPPDSPFHKQARSMEEQAEKLLAGILKASANKGKIAPLPAGPPAKAAPGRRPASKGVPSESGAKGAVCDNDGGFAAGGGAESLRRGSGGGAGRDLGGGASGGVAVLGIKAGDGTDGAAPGPLDEYGDGTGGRRPGGTLNDTFRRFGSSGGGGGAGVGGGGMDCVALADAQNLRQGPRQKFAGIRNLLCWDGLPLGHASTRALMLVPHLPENAYAWSLQKFLNGISPSSVAWQVAVEALARPILATRLAGTSNSASPPTQPLLPAAAPAQQHQQQQQQPLQAPPQVGVTSSVPSPATQAQAAAPRGQPLLSPAPPTALTAARQVAQAQQKLAATNAAAAMAAGPSPIWLSNATLPPGIKVAMPPAATPSMPAHDHLAAMSTVPPTYMATPRPPAPVLAAPPIATTMLPPSLHKPMDVAVAPRPAAAPATLGVSQAPATRALPTTGAAPPPTAGPAPVPSGTSPLGAGIHALLHAGGGGMPPAAAAAVAALASRSGGPVNPGLPHTSLHPGYPAAQPASAGTHTAAAGVAAPPTLSNAGGGHPAAQGPSGMVTQSNAADMQAWAAATGQRSPSRPPVAAAQVPSGVKTEDGSAYLSQAPAGAQGVPVKSQSLPYPLENVAPSGSVAHPSQAAGPAQVAQQQLQQQSQLFAQQHHQLLQQQQLQQQQLQQHHQLQQQQVQLQIQQQRMLQQAQAQAHAQAQAQAQAQGQQQQQAQYQFP